MIKNKSNLLALIILLTVFTIMKTAAQEAIPATGGEATGSGGTVSFTIGQVVYTTNVGVSHSEGQGVQQPYEISVITELGEAPDGIDLSVFPNPATEFLSLKQEGTYAENLTYELSDVHGRILKSGSLAGSNTSIQMADFPPSIYFLQVKRIQKNIKRFKSNFRSFFL